MHVCHFRSLGSLDSCTRKGPTELQTVMDMDALDDKKATPIFKFIVDIRCLGSMENAVVSSGRGDVQSPEALFSALFEVKDCFCGVSVEFRHFGRSPK